MIDLDKDTPGQGRDTSPLKLEQLSEYELRTIRAIELRLDEAPEACRMEDNPAPLDYCQKTQLRDPRVLLLDGGRGTGKTSLLLTMADWWHGSQRDRVNHHALNLKRKDALEKLGLGKPDIPDNVRVIRIIDFDPLPPGMPLIAGIVQAWKPLAKHYDDHPSSHEHKDGLLSDDWESLFQVATVGWTPITGGKGLIEQIIDREEQVRNWYEVSDSWQKFVNKIIARGRKVTQCAHSSPKTVFVIMIDDVDLQVKRIRELLPALRMLYHPNVFFIVAGDRHHMVDMLELDFQGQQNRLGDTKSRTPRSPRRFDQWPNTLAQAAFQKVFPITNIWSLKKLGLRELLAFSNLKAALNEWQSTSEKLGVHKGLGDYLYTIDRIGRFTGESSSAPTDGNGHVHMNSEGPERLRDPLDLPAIMPYRSSHQLSELVKDRGSSRKTALELMGQIVQGSDSANSQLKLNYSGDGKLEYLAVGELAANFPKVFTVDIGAGKELVLSGRPKFSFRDGFSKASAVLDDQADHWPQLLAASLRADGFGLIAPGLQWNVNLALAWTRIQLPDGLDLAFWWRVQVLPSPLRFVAWSRDWAEFINKLSVRTETTSGGEDKASQSERIAYGWIYYQLYWMSKNPVDFLKAVNGPLDARVGPKETKDWTKLLAQEPDRQFLLEEHDDEVGTWRNRTLPLLARPELFLPPHVQRLLLQSIERSTKVVEDLRDRRNKLITDAIAAASYPVNSADRAQSPADVKAREKRLNSEYQKFYGKRSPWLKAVDSPVAKPAKNRRKRLPRVIGAGVRPTQPL